MRYQILTAIFLCCFVFSAAALEDSTENREYHAKRYMDSQSSEEMFKDLAKNMAMNLPPEDREYFRNIILTYLDVSALDEANLKGLVKHFTADELASLADYYSSPLAKSAAKKMGVFMAEVMPTIQAEFFKAYGEMQKAEAEKNRSLSDVND